MEDSTMLARKKTALLLSAAVAHGAWSLAACADGKSSMELSYYSDWPGGKELAAQDYTAAIAAASAVGVGTHSTTALVGATNLCVAYTMTKAFREAVESCEAAVSLARQFDGPVARTASRSDATARALSNRGVLRALSGDVAGAAKDLQLAARREGTWKAPERNLAYLASSPEYRERLAVAERGSE
jgi:hypothetical protein